MTATPAFLLWSLQHECELREEVFGETGFPVLRHLRPLRAISESIEQGRFFEGVCVQAGSDAIEDPTIEHKGFVAEETFSFYGGESFVRDQCSDCPANASTRFYQNGLAGCCGMLQVDATRQHLPELVENAVEQLNADARMRELFPVTSSPWHALWIESPQKRQQLTEIQRLFEAMSNTTDRDHQFVDDHSKRAFEDFREAIRRAIAESLALHVELFPPGQTTPEKDWIVAAHCYRCKAQMQQEQRKCEVCRRPGGPHPTLRRRARGDRPYWSLSGFMGKDGAEQFLRRYWADRTLE